MKKILVMIAFLFSVVCYASPPPIQQTAVAGQVQYVVQNQVQTVQPAAQEVAFSYLGDRYNSTNIELIAEPVHKIKLPAMLVITLNYRSTAMNDMNKPPSLYCSNQEININKSMFKLNKQNTNYGYPLSAN